MYWKIDLILLSGGEVRLSGGVSDRTQGGEHEQSSRSGNTLAGDGYRTRLKEIGIFLFDQEGSRGCGATVEFVVTRAAQRNRT